jgi:sterol desaturase/sphingolipid hydroxylase (fatty acid hydroxylase superfamily)
VKNKPSSALKNNTGCFLLGAVAVLLLGYLLSQMLLEFNQSVPVSQLASMVSEPRWALTLLELVAWLVLLIVSIVLGVGVLLFALYPDRFSKIESRWISWRSQLKWLTWVIVLGGVLFPIFFLLYS